MVLLLTYIYAFLIAFLLLRMSKWENREGKENRVEYGYVPSEYKEWSKSITTIERIKYPLWAYILIIGGCLIPVVNTFIATGMAVCYYCINSDETEDRFIDKRRICPPLDKIAKFFTQKI